MRVDMVMPQMGESIAEGTIIKWLKKEGDLVQKDENILEISTDKVDSEIPSPAAGKIVELVASEGETVPVGSVVARIETEAGSVGPVPRAEIPQSTGKAAPQAAAAPGMGDRGELPSPPGEAKDVPAPTIPVSPGLDQVSSTSPSGRDGEGRFYSPLVRSIAQAEGIPLSELGQIQGSGREGRITKDDLLRYVERKKGRTLGGEQPTRLREGGGEAPPARASGGRAHPAPTITMPAPTETRTTTDGPIDVIPMDHIRQRIAEHMVRSKATSPHVASVTEADMTQIVRWREKNKEAFERHEGFKLTFTPFFVQATARALRDFPFMNASVEGRTILVKRFVNIGMAVATDYGLVVPVLRGADALSFLGIARAVNDLATRARSRNLKPDEVTGGTFSITNMGTVGTLFGVPIIAQPQVGILGIGAIQKRPVVRDDAIGIRDMMYMCLSYDHRLIDGAMGGAFIERVAQNLETTDLE